ncbi:hypothetical protein SAMN05443248_8698 [Bradyrhizobium erythrophlei]|jgi:hypothetical protein|uniref:Uncharacterized protein n=1 Tax=Bradyrhizobium erythrophlei TaxID=1437360 RepID=A0A1M5YRL1_9BRAD|nr:hypothetical protein SAMN05443248_8698 [Bradyrhizobium erythrophlei]
MISSSTGRTRRGRRHSASGFPGRCAARRSLRRGALLIRGPCWRESMGSDSAEQREEALHRVRDMMARTRRRSGCEAPAAFPGCCAARRSLRCGALLIQDPCRRESMGPGSAEQREEALHRVRDMMVLPAATPRLSFLQIQHRSRRHDAAGINVAMAFVVMMLDVEQVHGLRDQRLPIKFFQIAL